MTRNHGGEILGRAIMEKKSLRRPIHWKKNHREENIEKESWRRSRGGAIIEEGACRRHMGSIWEVSGKHLGCF